MEIKEIFRRPNREIANQEVLSFKKSNALFCYTLFVAGTKVDDEGKIEIDSESVLTYGVAPFVKKEGVFDERPDAQTLIKTAKNLYKDSVKIGFDGLILGYYNHINNTIVYDAYLEDFYKVNNPVFINCYFTLKLKEMKFDREIFEREYFDVINHIAKNGHLPVTIEQFILFKSKLELYVMSGMAEPKRGMGVVSEGLIRIMEATFTDVETPQDQLIVSKFLEQLGCLNCRITTDRKHFKPLSDNYPTEPCEIVFVPNNRFITIYSK